MGKKWDRFNECFPRKERLAVYGILVYLVFSIVIIVYTKKVFKYSSKNPFDKQLEPNENWSDFFNETPIFKKQCKCGEEILNDFCNEEQILSGCVDVTENPLKNNKQFLRYLKMGEQKCNEYKNEIKNLGNEETLNKVFTLKFNTIHKLALGLLILVIIGFVILVLFCILSCFFLLIEYAGGALIIIGFFINILVNGVIYLINLILFIILSNKYFKSDTSTYVDFLDCKGVNKDKFNKKFEKVENLKNVFITYFVLFIIYLVLFVVKLILMFRIFS